MNRESRVIFSLLVLTLSNVTLAGYNPRWISVSPSRAMVAQGSGDTVRLTATFQNDPGPYEAVAFALAGRQAQVTANANGTDSPDWDISGSSAGTYQGTASIGNVTAQCRVEVRPLTITYASDAYTLLAGGKDNNTDRLSITITCTPATNAAATITLVDGGQGATTGQITVLGSAYTAPEAKARLTGTSMTPPMLQVDSNNTQSSLQFDSSGNATVVLRSSNLIGDKVKINVAFNQYPMEFTSPEYIFESAVVTQAFFSLATGEPVDPVVGGTYKVRFTSTYSGLPVVGHTVIAYVNQIQDTDDDTVTFNEADPTTITQGEINEVAAFVELQPLAKKVTDQNGEVEYSITVKERTGSFDLNQDDLNAIEAIAE